MATPKKLTISCPECGGTGKITGKITPKGKVRIIARVCEWCDGRGYFMERTKTILEYVKSIGNGTDNNTPK